MFEKKIYFQVALRFMLNTINSGGGVGEGKQSYEIKSEWEAALMVTESSPLTQFAKMSDHWFQIKSALTSLCF